MPLKLKFYNTESWYVKVKMGCLDKSKLDWNSYVEAEGIKEELATHNRGKDG